jgi:hypothetical protein
VNILANITVANPFARLGMNEREIIAINIQRVSIIN